MRFAENNRVSHRQLYRQIVLALTAPLLLCLPSRGWGAGLPRVAGTAAAVVLLLFYVIFLIRLEPCFSDPIRTAGGFWGRVTGVFFLVYVVLCGAFLLMLIVQVVSLSLISGIPGWITAILALLTCAAGSSRGMQRRGRIADVSAGFCLIGIFLLVIVCVFQAKLPYLEEIPGFEAYGAEKTLRSSWLVLGAFSAVGLLPFALDEVEKPAGAAKPTAFAVLTVGALLIVMELLIPAVLGADRAEAEIWPILPLLAGADLPGNVLARFDVIWMGLILFGMLFSLGSLLHYGHLIAKRTRLGSGRYWLEALVYIVAGGWIFGIRILDVFEDYVKLIFLPGLLLIQILFYFGRKAKRRKKAPGLLCMCLFLTGCSAAVEPEKRMYPLAMGADASGEEIQITYGVPDLPKATGQGKEEEGSSASVLSLSGKDFEEIRFLYDRTQEKLLDLGHLQILVLGSGAQNGSRWQDVLDYLRQESFAGEDIYVFEADSASEILEWSGFESSSAGEYVTGLIENRLPGEEMPVVTLGDLLYEQNRSGSLPKLPKLMISGDQLYVLAANEE